MNRKGKEALAAHAGQLGLALVDYQGGYAGGHPNHARVLIKRKGVPDVTVSAPLTWNEAAIWIDGFIDGKMTEARAWRTASCAKGG